MHAAHLCQAALGRRSHQKGWKSHQQKKRSVASGICPCAGKSQTFFFSLQAIYSKIFSIFFPALPDKCETCRRSSLRHCQSKSCAKEIFFLRLSRSKPCQPQILACEGLTSCVKDLDTEQENKQRYSDFPVKVSFNTMVALTRSLHAAGCQ